MSRSATTKFIEEIERVIDYFRQEFNLSYAEAIGCLYLVIEDIVQETREQE